MARSTKGKVVYLASQYAAKVHFNHMTIQDEMAEKLTHGKAQTLKIRYGIVDIDDVLRDLETWETLLVSSFM